MAWVDFSILSYRARSGSLIRKNKTPPRNWERNKESCEGKPIVGIVEVADPIQIGFTLGIVPPDIARVTVALESYVRDTVHITTPRFLSGLYFIRHL